MAGRRRSVRTGLLAITLITFFPVAASFAQEESQPHIQVIGAQDRPFAGSSWVLTLLVAHDDPNEVEVLAPPFIGNLLLEQMAKGPRYRNTATGQTFTSNPGMEGSAIYAGQESSPAVFELWTAIEYRFALYSQGAVSFDSFTVTTPRGQVRTSPFDLHVQRPPNMAETQRYQLNWAGVPQGLSIGESAVFSLHIRGWSSAATLPDASLFLPPVPQGHFLEPLPISIEERSAGMALRLRLVPIDAAPFVLASRQIPHGASVFELPALRIPVSRPAGAQAETSAPAGFTANDSGKDLPFPAYETAASEHARLYQRYQAEYASIYGMARDLWEQGSHAQALAVLRQNERDHRAGTLFAVLRREAEHSLGFTGTGDEKKRSLLPFLRGGYQIAVLRETPFRHIPDPAGEVAGRFREGQPVLLSPPIGPASQRRESWLRVIANDLSGITGWVPGESIIIY